MGSDWKVDETGDVLRAMNAVEDILILGIYSGDRMTEYTKPGYERYARSAMALISRGWEYGRHLLHLCFPKAGHSETAWGTRLHLPLQFLNGAVARAYRVIRPVLGDRAFERATTSPESR